MNQTQDLISCICPTYNRPTLLSKAIEQWLNQTYQNKELIIVDDGEESVEEVVKTFNHPDIRYIRWDYRISIGRKRNIACENAKGTLIAHWDDDDWNHSSRLTEQANVLKSANVAVTGYNSVLIYNQAADRAIHYYEDPSTVVGGTLLYSLNYWKVNRFPDVNIGEDTYFSRRIPPSSLISTNGVNRYVVLDGHGANISKRNFDDWLARYPEVVVDPIFEMTGWTRAKGKKSKGSAVTQKKKEA